MACFVCFIDDTFQEKIRLNSQSKSERFEEILKDFQNNFLNELELLESVNDCDIHRNMTEVVKNCVEDLRTSINSHSDYISYFNDIRTVYIEWIKGNVAKSILEFTKLLSRKQIFESDFETSPDELEKNSIFFRGRKSKSILSREELFHIPFNKRHLIKNQRYSVTGQPLLYLGLCPMDVVYELREDISNLDDIQFTSYMHRSNDRFRILDMTNRFPERLRDLDLVVSGVNYDEKKSFYDGVNLFYKFILIGFCSFKRSRISEGGIFAEEYVLPQLLTYIVKEEGFNGILFSSTRFPSNIIVNNSKFHINRYRENLVLFTEYSEFENQDENLFKRFLVSKTVNVNDCLDFSLADIITESKKNDKLDRRKISVPTFPFDRFEVNGTRSIKQFEDLEINIKGSLIKYFEHPIGKIHLCLLNQIILDFRNRISDKVTDSTLRLNS